MTAITGQPAYQQVAEDLRKKITEGVYPVGSSLPSTQRLMDEYQVSITVIRAAINSLRTEGVVIGQQGKAVFVQAEPAPDKDSEYEELKRRLDLIDKNMRGFEERLASLEARRTSDE